jgi:unsaturated chondroitin disaccharide hydrolase
MYNKHIKFIMSVITVAILCGCSCDKFDVDKAIDYCDKQVHRSINDLRRPDNSISYSIMPRNIAPGETAWACREVCPQEWCSGFWPGILWYDYEATADTAILHQAERFTDELASIVNSPIYDHDLGFIIFTSMGNGYRLTGNKQYKHMIFEAADSLATLYNETVGTICSWPRHKKQLGGHNTIMDNMINIEMLYWVARNGGNPSLYNIATRHAETTMRNQFRDDYTSFHVALYDEFTGEFLRGCTHQGYSDDSMWARGQAWAIYGFTMVYRETHDPKFLDFVTKVTDVYLNRLPKDMIPYWDFDDPAIPNAPRDASAACIVASALLELADYVSSDKSAIYYDSAVKMLTELSTKRYQSRDVNHAFLLHSVGHHPAGTEIDYSIIYADYYYLEALLRLKKHNRK